MNYTQLAKNYQGDSSYFDAKVRQIAENLLYQNKVDGAGGTEVANISGIVKVDDRTISINCLGYSCTTSAISWFSRCITTVIRIIIITTITSSV